MAPPAATARKLDTAPKWVFYWLQMPISADFLALLRCPKCRGEVSEETTAAGPGLVCRACRLVYPIVDDIPQFLEEEARKL